MEITFYVSGLVSILATLRVIIHKQPIHALLYFIISLLAISCVFFALGAYFAGALEIIVYAGAIVVLFVFVVMTLNISVDYNEKECTWINFRNWIGPSLLTLLLLIILVYALSISKDYDIAGKVIMAKTLGITLFGPYVLAVELVSILLLASLITSLHLGRCEARSTDVFHNRSKLSNLLNRDGEK